LAIRRYDLEIRRYDLATRRYEQRNASFVMEFVDSTPQYSVFSTVSRLFSILETDR
jgi:hypothetical protein